MRVVETVTVIDRDRTANGLSLVSEGLDVRLDVGHLEDDHGLVAQYGAKLCAQLATSLGETVGVVSGCTLIQWALDGF